MRGTARIGGREGGAGGLRRRPTSTLVALGLALAVLAAAAGCEDGFEPFAPTGETLALYGFLDAARDTQRVRVEPVLVAPDALPDPAAIRLTATDLEAGGTVPFTGEVVPLDGRRALLFSAPFRPLPGRTYRLAAEGPDGTAQAAVTVPAEPAVEVGEPLAIGGIVTQRVLLAGLAEGPEDARVVWRVQAPGAPPAEVDFDGEAEAVPEGRRFVFSLTRQADLVRARLPGLPDDTTAALLGLRLRYRLVEEAAPDHGGVGALGAVAAFEVAWTLPDTLVADLGFRVPEP